METNALAEPKALVPAEFEDMGPDIGFRCRHCSTIVIGHATSNNRKKHLASCKRLPETLRNALDQAAVREARNGKGRYGGTNANIYNKFRVVGLYRSECKACGRVIIGHVTKLRRHLSGACSGVRVTWETVDVDAQFEKTPDNVGRRCRHCTGIVKGHGGDRRRHLAVCKCLPRSVQAVMDNAAVCESLAGKGRYGGANARLFSFYRVVGFHRSECKKCGLEIQGNTSVLKRHLELHGEFHRINKRQRPAPAPGAGAAAGAAGAGAVVKATVTPATASGEGKTPEAVEPIPASAVPPKRRRRQAPTGVPVRPVGATRRGVARATAISTTAPAAEAASSASTGKAAKPSKPATASKAKGGSPSKAPSAGVPSAVVAARLAASAAAAGATEADADTRGSA